MFRLGAAARMSATACRVLPLEQRGMDFRGDGCGQSETSRQCVGASRGGYPSTMEDRCARTSAGVPPRHSASPKLRFRLSLLKQVTVRSHAAGVRQMSPLGRHRPPIRVISARPRVTKRRLRVVTEPESVAGAGGDRDNVLQCAAEFDTDDIAGIDPGRWDGETGLDLCSDAGERGLPPPYGRRRPAPLPPQEGRTAAVRASGMVGTDSAWSVRGVFEALGGAAHHEPGERGQPGRNFTKRAREAPVDRDFGIGGRAARPDSKSREEEHRER